MKLDVEGVETAVLEEAGANLANVARVILEFHGTAYNPGNSIDRLTEILRAAGLMPEVRQFGSVVSLADIQRDVPYWLTVRAERRSGLLAAGYRLSAIGRRLGVSRES